MNTEGSKYEAMRAVRDEVMALKTSPLYEYRTRNNYLPVIGEGSHDAAIMFVGEAPGKNEALQGRPFVGVAAAGKPLAVRAVGMIMSKNYDPSIPCHRVVRADGKVGDYNRGGAARKMKLLREEGAI